MKKKWLTKGLVFSIILLLRILNSVKWKKKVVWINKEKMGEKKASEAIQLLDAAGISYRYTDRKKKKNISL